MFWAMDVKKFGASLQATMNYTEHTHLLWMLWVQADIVSHPDFLAVIYNAKSIKAGVVNESRRQRWNWDAVPGGWDESALAT